MLLDLVKDLRHEHSEWMRLEPFGGGKRNQLAFESLMAEKFPAIAEALLVAVEALEKIEESGYGCGGCGSSSYAREALSKIL